MRADRIVAVLLLLQARGRVTAADVAEELEVSPRTARRDLEALAQAGIPVYSQPGRGGGWFLVGGARTDLTGLSAEEARALFVSTAGSAWVAGPELEAALRKLTVALPAPFQDAAVAATTSVLVEPGAWGRASTPRPEHLGALQTAVIEQRRVRLGYTSRTSGDSVRVIDPLGLVAKGSWWYLLAYTDRGERLFRVDRATSVHLTDEPSSRPPGFDLEEAWQQVASHIDGYRSRVRCRAVISPGWIGLLRAVLGERVTDYGVKDLGEHRVEIGGQSATEIAGAIAGFGRHVIVDDSTEVRQELARVGEELVATYG